MHIAWQLHRVSALSAGLAMTWLLLFGVAPTDPLTFESGPPESVLTALVATWVPATYASRADPATALRAE